MIKRLPLGFLGMGLSMPSAESGESASVRQPTRQTSTPETVRFYILPFAFTIRPWKDYSRRSAKASYQSRISLLPGFDNSHLQGYIDRGTFTRQRTSGSEAAHKRLSSGVCESSLITWLGLDPR